MLQLQSLFKNLQPELNCIRCQKLDCSRVSMIMALLSQDMFPEVITKILSHQAPWANGAPACCLFCFLVTLFVISSIIFLLIFLPQEPKFTITDASLTQFNLSATNFNSNNKLLIYKLSLNVTFRNPNNKVGFYFDRVRVIANYRKKRFALVTLNNTTPFYQGRKNTTVLHHVVLEGQQTMSFKEKDDEHYELETSSGVYSIDVKLALKLRVRYGKIKTKYFKPPTINCNNLKLSLSNHNDHRENGGLNFKPVKCKNIHIFTSESGEVYR
uniref:Late embryogenesis abundant protein LEA-2 subgroup domain-containing protein n=1 Tax=Cannabis sativa TaxID=3483 RepID=A0A803P5J1_CANSA